MLSGSVQVGRGPIPGEQYHRDSRSIPRSESEAGPQLQTQDAGPEYPQKTRGEDSTPALKQQKPDTGELDAVPTLF